MKEDSGMNNPPVSYQRPERLVFIVGLAIGFCILGDSFLYVNLPIEAEKLGIALPLVGILLSANRIIRLFSNTWVSAIFEKFGPRKPFIISVGIALLTTSLYGVRWGFAVFLLARIGWGIAWSALRQGGYQAVWTGGDTSKGKLMGLLWGMIRLGSALSGLMGGYLRDLWGYRAGVFGVLCVTSLGIPVALSIRWPPESQRLGSARRSFRQGWREALKTERGRRLLVAGLANSAFEGVLVATASLFLARRLGSFEFLAGLGIRIGTIAGLLLSVRWLSDIFFSPVMGALSDRWGQLQTLVILACVLMVSLVGAVNLSGPLLVIGLALLFVSSAGLYVTLSALANGYAMGMERPHIYMGVYATAIDAGGALGPLVAYFLGTFVDFSILYVAAAAVLVLAILRCWWWGRRE